MPRKNRGYKRGEPFRDARLFVIVCEGNKREKEYFTLLTQEIRRVKIKVLPPPDTDSGKSAPKYIIDRAAKYVEEHGLSEADQLWLVMDIDRWDHETIYSIGNRCHDTPLWHIALSNPCFEIWLHFHLQDISSSPIKTCQKLKQELHTMADGGYNAIYFIKKANEATQRAKTADNNKDHFYPEDMRTKIYQLVGEILTL